MIGIITVLLVLGIILMVLGITKKTGFQGDWNEGMALFFFILGIMHLAAALFLFNSPIPLGALVNQTTTYSAGYNEFMNGSVDCVNFTWVNASDPTNATWGCEHNFNTSITGTVTNEYDYFTEPENQIGGYFFYVWLFALLFYSAIYGLSYLRRSFTERGKLW